MTELIGPKKRKDDRQKPITGNRDIARLHMLLHSCTPIAFSHTKNKGVQVNPNIINCNKNYNQLLHLNIHLLEYKSYGMQKHLITVNRTWLIRYSHVFTRGFWEGKSIRLIKLRVSKCPINRCSRWMRKRQYIHSSPHVNRLELLWLPHYIIHEFTVQHKKLLSKLKFF